MNKMQNLSKNQQIIFDLIDKSPEPMKAYSILHNVQKKGIKAPLQVYRALFAGFLKDYFLYTFLSLY